MFGGARGHMTSQLRALYRNSLVKTKKNHSLVDKLQSNGPWVIRKHVTRIPKSIRTSGMQVVGTHCADVRAAVAGATR